MERLNQQLPKTEATRTEQRYVSRLVIAPFGIASAAAGLWLHVAGLALVWGWKVPFGHLALPATQFFGRLVGIIYVRTA